ncbi:hypothetical protein COY16_03815 [Candidatus Roizmanbacteria bacterium CG_4_10_14_0_2_um_filter_39_13]|uniref:Acyltransferase 3 domain-containing protein n=1 Tax=Candidatus Roizmanbacteria bacterium CG_4_10_14_0_2_um_filter_39_13 TaxID=1974825 RepID=A0A2M7TXU0_9BACT|nr:MAG: hypothetical protein COY16_03815 [Candidatus Roizmanbacteria bacterium CG_4_10_14_0_2_um_filter_39_13]
MVKARNTTIDFLRGLAVILMILIHATAYFLDQKYVYILWDYSHFVVPLFIFCSAYVAFQRKDAGSISFTQIFKRLRRLLIPYYIFTIVLILLFGFVLHKEVSYQFILNWLLLGSERDVGWLVVLFVYVIFLIPIIVRAAKFHLLRKFLMKTVWLIPILLLFAPPIESFRFMMWLPWTAFLIFVYWFTQEEEKRWFPWYALVLFTIGFFLSRFILIFNSHTLVFTENKYPPNFYYLSYGTVLITFLYYFHRFLTRKKLFTSWLQKWFDFLSRHSYSLFFIHFLYVYILKDLTNYRSLEWWGFFGVITMVSVFTQMVINKAHLIVKGIIPK